MCRVYNSSLFDWDGYYQWLVDIVKDHNHEDYDLLLKQLYETDYIWIDNGDIVDSGRAAYGVRLRDDYCDSLGGDAPEYVYEEPCNVLEMLIALSIQIEEDIMAEPGNYNPGYWFWVMIKNLGLDGCVDYMFDGRYVADCLDIWMNRRYRRNGVGGLFPVPGTTKDQRNLSTWLQANEYLIANYCIAGGMG